MKKKLKNEANILLVDDDSQIIQQVKYHLKKMGFGKIFEAYDAYSALEILGQENIDLIISDWKMIGVSGLGLLEMVRKDKKNHDIPFIMLTVESHKEYIMEAIKKGVSDYMLKPVNAELIQNKVGKYFE